MSYLCWLESQTPQTKEWRRCEQLGKADDLNLIYRDSDTQTSPLAFAESLLDTYLLSVLHLNPPIGTRVRACVRLDSQPMEEPPAVIREVTRDEIRRAYHRKALDDATQRLLSACHSVVQADNDVFQAVVHAQKLGVSQVATTRLVQEVLGETWASQTVEAVGLAQEVRAAITACPDVASRINVRVKDHNRVVVTLSWSRQDEEAEQARDQAWNETIEEYDYELANELLASARQAVADVIEGLSDRFDLLLVTGPGRSSPATPQTVAPSALIYQEMDVRRQNSTSSAGACALEETS
ncbi:hypothetical protein [Streptomyces sp. NPDC058644]|uniref:hypothetical protein n=1 Tax=unclassified Streptomyces TaxID=2593676 RepID=UPI003659C73F